MPFLSRVANLATFGYRYNVGFSRRGPSVLYVHPGLGTTGPPMRLGVAPEEVSDNPHPARRVSALGVL